MRPGRNRKFCEQPYLQKELKSQRQQAIQPLALELRHFTGNRARPRRELSASNDEKTRARILENVASSTRRIAELQKQLHSLRTERFIKLVKRARMLKLPRGKLTYTSEVYAAVIEADHRIMLGRL